MAPIAVAVTVVIKEDMVERFLEVMKEDVVGSLERENGGCLRFDVLRDPSTPNKYMFYEMYADADAAARHKETPHYKAWAKFKEDGGVLSQEAVKFEAVYGGGL